MKESIESRARAKAIGLLAAALFIVSMTAVGGASAAPALNPVQINLQPAKSLPYQYSLTAYNTSGYQVASYQSIYPAAAFQLPVGAYLLAASAYYQNNTYCYECPLGAAATGGVGAVVRPYLRPYTEYGYSVTQVNGPTSISIKMQNASTIPLTSLSIHVGYANGTAAVDASVSGYVVGSYYVYSPKMVTYGQTDKSGTVTLVVPQAPIEVSAYLSFPIRLPRNTSTVTVEVGGQKVNVTVYLQPSYVSLQGQALVLPPQTSADIVLEYRPFQPVVYYAGTSTAAGTGAYTTSATTAQAPGASQGTSQTRYATRIAPFNPTGDQITTGSASSAIGSGALVTALEVAAVGVLVAGIALSALWAKKSRKGAPPG